MDSIINSLARAYVADPTNESAKTALANAVARSISHQEQEHKILISTDFGAGWSSWCYGSDEERRFILTHPGLIAAVEAGETLHDNHPSFNDFAVECQERGYGIPYSGGIGSLEVVKVKGVFRINEYDGAESVQTLDDWLSSSIYMKGETDE